MAYTQLRELILIGELPPGSTLDQETLAANLGLSTTPVREALRRLESERLVVSRAHRDTVVASVTSDDLRNIYTIRLQLDPLAVKLAAAVATDAEREEMKRLLDDHPHDSDPIKHLNYNRRLHRTLYAACGNDFLVHLLDQLWDLSDRHRFLTLRERSVVQTAHAEHSAIVLAVVAGNADVAAALMRAHVDQSLARIG